jgi:hypothetical protein
MSHFDQYGRKPAKDDARTVMVNVRITVAQKRALRDLAERTGVPTATRLYNMLADLLLPRRSDD